MASTFHDLLPLVINIKHDLIICIECEIAIDASKAKHHLSNVHKIQADSELYDTWIGNKQMTLVSDLYKQLISNKDHAHEPIVGIPILAGFRCNECHHLSVAHNTIRKHCKTHNNNSEYSSCHVQQLSKQPAQNGLILVAHEQPLIQQLQAQPQHVSEAILNDPIKQQQRRAFDQMRNTSTTGTAYRLGERIGSLAQTDEKNLSLVYRNKRFKAITESFGAGIVNMLRWNKHVDMKSEFERVIAVLCYSYLDHGEMLIKNSSDYLLKKLYSISR